MIFSKGKYFLLLGILFVIYIGLIILAFFNLNTVTKADTGFVNDVTIVLDAGHGGEDGGATANGIIEKDINLSISNMLADIFTASGYNVISTRTEDVMINTDGETLRERKVSDMKNRLEIFNHSEANIILSIHQNMFTQDKYSGTQIFYSTNHDESLQLAESIRNTVVKFIQPENSRETKPSTKDIYLLHNATNPAIIVECGFISNRYEAEKLKTEEYQKQLAFAIFSGFTEYYNN